MKLRKYVVYDWLGFPIGYECPSKGIKIITCNKEDADKIVIKNHYSGKATKNTFISFLVEYYNEINGVLQIGYGIRPKIKGNFNPDEVREFDRMWLSDKMPKYSETIVLSLLHRYIRIAYPKIKALISYADTTVGNTGTIYRAANYIQIGNIKADFYILPNGERIHPVSMYHRHKTRKWSFLQKQYEGILKADGRQLKFVYYLKRGKHELRQ